jgi:hypothetical protein
MPPYSKEIRQQALARLAKDKQRLKYDSKITSLTKKNPGDRKINVLEKEKEQYLAEAYPELFEGKKW